MRCTCTISLEHWVTKNFNPLPKGQHAIGFTTSGAYTYVSLNYHRVFTQQLSTPILQPNTPPFQFLAPFSQLFLPQVIAS
jgi:hypothetical protein